MIKSINAGTTGTDASTASVFLLKFLEKIKQHNLKDYNDH